MIYNNNLLLFLLEHDQNGVYDCNLRFIRESMRLDELAVSKFKLEGVDLPNIVILTKSTTPGEVQVIYAHASTDNKSLG